MPPIRYTASLAPELIGFGSRSPYMESLLISLLVAVLVFGLIYWVISIIPLPPPFRTVALVIMAVIALVWLLEFLPGSGFHFPR